ncbi:hypothetical protein CPT_Mendera_231 [Stenotrophomonas phage Mendera]|uniref:Uncharacterized protein n=2 Tax=Menderavirus TaxID=2843421 RepID=A0A0H4IPC6_9CAUD|nr:hypothetical protein HWC60_gp184 [Stenotrophomonas phage Mendera]YP_010077798.1 hypothetical protein KMC40_gp153 [Stenotrophomonas phage IME-SM1]AKO61605.1 hypothetical protein [Stenotrophomonas phage IME-SM1]QFR56757.1 hypothetical protein CPT_Mendera_231 [Stenotrophomonas phage Mendera]
MSIKSDKFWNKVIKEATERGVDLLSEIENTSGSTTSKFIAVDLDGTVTIFEKRPRIDSNEELFDANVFSVVPYTVDDTKGWKQSCAELQSVFDLIRKAPSKYPASEVIFQNFLSVQPLHDLENDIEAINTFIERSGGDGQPIWMGFDAYETEDGHTRVQLGLYEGMPRLSVDRTSEEWLPAEPWRRLSCEDLVDSFSAEGAGLMSAFDYLELAQKALANLKRNDFVPDPPVTTPEKESEIVGDRELRAEVIFALVRAGNNPDLIVPQAKELVSFIVKGH